jgi:hypothetical protein
MQEQETKTLENTVSGILQVYLKRQYKGKLTVRVEPMNMDKKNVFTGYIVFLTNLEKEVDIQALCDACNGDEELDPTFSVFPGPVKAGPDAKLDRAFCLFLYK